MPSSIFLDTIPEDSKCLGVRTISHMGSCTTLAISHLCPYPTAAAAATAGLANTKQRTPMLITSTVPNVAELSQLQSRTGDNRELFFFRQKLQIPTLALDSFANLGLQHPCWLLPPHSAACACVDTWFLAHVACMPRSPITTHLTVSPCTFPKAPPCSSVSGSPSR